MSNIITPSWASDDALDEVFANWVPGQLPEQDIAEVEPLDTVDVFEEPEDQLDTLLSVALQAAPDIVEPDPVPFGTPAIAIGPLNRWTPADDDLLPTRRFSLRRR